MLASPIDFANCLRRRRRKHSCLKSILHTRARGFSSLLPPPPPARRPSRRAFPPRCDWSTAAPPPPPSEKAAPNGETAAACGGAAAARATTDYGLMTQLSSDSIRRRAARGAAWRAGCEARGSSGRGCCYMPFTCDVHNISPFGTSLILPSPPCLCFTPSLPHSIADII